MGPRRAQNRLGQRIEQAVEAFNDFAVSTFGMNTES